MDKLLRNNLIYAGLMGIFGILILISPWMVWTVYKVMNPPGLLKSFSLIPSDFADAAWLFYDLLPIMSWLPVFGAILLFVGVGIFFLELGTYKTLFKIGHILNIIMFIIFLGFVLLFVMAELFTIDLSMIGIPIQIQADFTQPPTFNGPGGWMLIISAIGAIIVGSKLKIPEYEEYLDEFKGIKDEDIRVLKKKVVAGVKVCPKCGNRVSSEQLFCSQCGRYF
ncbi:MAG: zinc ribbon domain-containing protein [Candidatus Helarchaeota archaeon]